MRLLTARLLLMESPSRDKFLTLEGRAYYYSSIEDSSTWTDPRTDILDFSLGSREDSVLLRQNPIGPQIPPSDDSRAAGSASPSHIDEDEDEDEDARLAARLQAEEDAQAQTRGNAMQDYANTPLPPRSMLAQFWNIFVDLSP